LAQRSSTSSHTDYSGPEIIIVTDCRRPSDLNFFRNEFGNAAVFIRIDASLEIRNKRGFTFVEGIDDAETECALDNFTEWQFNVYNNGMNDDIPEFLNIYDFIRSKI
jgi:phosphomevalonate kinase